MKGIESAEDFAVFTISAKEVMLGRYISLRMCFNQKQKDKQLSSTGISRISNIPTKERLTI